MRSPLYGFQAVRKQGPIGGFDVAIHLMTGAVLTYFGFAPEVGRARVAN